MKWWYRLVFDVLLGLRLLVFLSLLVAFFIMRVQIRPYLGWKAFYLILAGLMSVIAAQTIQVYAYYGEHHEWRLIADYTFYLADIILVIGVVWGVLTGLHLLDDFQQTRQRESWLRQVYENIPVAIFVVKDEKIIYSNQVFISLQNDFEDQNPFSSVKGEQHEVWLNAKSGERFAFWVNKFSLEKIDGDAYIVTDITSLKLQDSFIQQIAKDLNVKHNNTMQRILKLIHEFIPNSILYVGEMSEEKKRFQYIAHEGNGDGFIFKDQDINVQMFNSRDWTWFDLNKEKNISVPSVVFKSKSNFLGGILLEDEQGDVLGIILLLQQDSVEVSDLLLDFLSVFSIRVRSELEHRQDRRMLERSSNRYRAFIESSNEAIADIILNPSVQVDESVDEQWGKLRENATISEVNPAFMSFFEFNQTPSRLEFFNVKSLKHMMHYVLESGYSHDVIEVAHQKRNGDVHWISCTVMADIEERRLHRLWIILRDITESKTHIQHLEYQAKHDKLTGLANRSALRDYLDEKIDQANQFGLKAALVLIDLDRFKEVNDALGHHYGDVLLRNIEPRIRNIVGERRAFLARLGGDEFAVVVPSISGEKEALKIANEIIRSLSQPFDLGQLNVEVGCSVGIAFYPNNGTDTSTLMRCADIAMYKAKKEKQGVLCYQSEMDENSPRRLALMTDMNKGLREQEFFLVYQPKLNLGNNKVFAAEALIRWQHNELDLISPAEFIPLAEMSDVIISMTQWVIEQTLKQIQDWQKQGLEIKTSVNVSTRNLLDEDLIEFIKRKLDQYQVPAHLLEIEITESALMVDPERALNTLNKISEMGVGISIDDFGTGYSSLIYLRQLPITTLKIDIMFVRNMCSSQQDEIIVNSIINLAHNLSLTVVAEGAESLQTLEKLKVMGCNMVQGYIISKPVLADEFVLVQGSWGK